MDFQYHEHTYIYTQIYRYQYIYMFVYMYIFQCICFNTEQKYTCFFNAHGISILLYVRNKMEIWESISYFDKDTIRKLNFWLFAHTLILTVSMQLGVRPFDILVYIIM